MIRLSHLFKNIRPEESGPVFVLSIVLLSNSIAQKVSEISSISNFINDVGVPQILLIWIIDGIVLMFTTGLQSLLVDRFDRIKLIKNITFGLALAYVFLRILFLFNAPKWITYSLFYLFSQQQAFFFPLIVWILANDLFGVVQSKRIFPFIANWELSGNLLGIGIAALAPISFLYFGFKPEELLIFNVFIYLLIYIILNLGMDEVSLRPVQSTKDSMRKTLSEGWSFVREVPAFHFLSISLFAVWICDTILEFHFLVVSEAAFSVPSRYQAFYSLVVLLRVLGYMFIQSFLAEKVISRIGLKNTFFISPIFSLSGVTLALLISNLVGGVSSIITHKLPLFSISENAVRSFQGFVPEERRGRVTIFMDSYLNAGGNILASVIIGGILLLSIFLNFRSYAHYVYLSVGLVTTLGMLWATYRMQKVYDSSLLNWRLKRRQRGKSVLDNIDF